VTVCDIEFVFHIALSGLFYTFSLLGPKIFYCQVLPSRAVKGAVENFVVICVCGVMFRAR